jgi:ABC-type transport system involved in resistance to organic solvents, permease component
MSQASQHTSPPWQRRLLASLGRTTFLGIHHLLIYLSLSVTVLVVAFKRGTWNRPVRGEFRRILRGVTVEALPTTAVTGLLIGFALVSQAVYWLAQTGTTGVIGPVIVVLLVREFVPILIGLLLFGRSGTAALVELGEAQTHGLLRSFEVQGLNPLQLLIIPRAFAFAVGAFCLATVLLVTTLAAGYLVAYGMGLVSYSVWDFIDLVLRALQANDFIFPPLKCMTIGFVVALACCGTGLGRRETDELQRLVPRGFIRSALAIFVVNSLIDLVS